ncbi:helix-turn-helix domain-containing protein [Streptomyces microflavus]
MDRCAAAEALNIHPNTVLYRLRKTPTSPASTPHTPHRPPHPYLPRTHRTPVQRLNAP